MATLAVWQYDTADGAGRAATSLELLADDDAPVLQDAALVEWQAGARKPRTRQLEDSPATGALDVGFWGLLFGLIFYVPLLGAAIGAATGALAGALADIGIDDHFINRVRDRVTPGTSALFLLTSGGLADRGAAALITAELDRDQEAALRAVFAD
jgi:uncharacterized membrane protein